MYTLYGLDDDGRPRFDWLDPHTFTDVRAEFGAPDELAVKAGWRSATTPRNCPDESVLARLAGPPGRRAPRSPPSAHRAAPAQRRCFFEEVFAFSQFGIDPERVTATLEAARAAAAGA